jgi:hypothetical protein
MFAGGRAGQSLRAREWQYAQQQSMFAGRRAGQSLFASARGSGSVALRAGQCR